MTDASGTARPAGRPQKLDGEGTPTRERLLLAASAACVERGFEGVTLGDIARRAGVSTPAVYNHFSSKSELMVQACRLALRRLAPDGATVLPDPAEIVRRYLSPEFADGRILQTELHLASLRHDDVRELLAKWHGDRAAEWTSERGVDPAAVKGWFLLLLGLGQLDALATLDADADEVQQAVAAMAHTLLPDHTPKEA